MIKSFIGLGILATPFGFKLCGILIGSLIIVINAAMNWFTVRL